MVYLIVINIIIDLDSLIYRARNNQFQKIFRFETMLEKTLWHPQYAVKSGPYRLIKLTYTL